MLSRGDVFLITHAFSVLATVNEIFVLTKISSLTGPGGLKDNARLEEHFPLEGKMNSWVDVEKGSSEVKKSMLGANEPGLETDLEEEGPSSVKDMELGRLWKRM